MWLLGYLKLFQWNICIHSEDIGHGQYVTTCLKIMSAGLRESHNGFKYNLNQFEILGPLQKFSSPPWGVRKTNIVTNISNQCLQTKFFPIHI